jgi:hypothetical protein
MKRNLVLVFCLTASAIQAQQTNELDALKRQLQEATEKFDRTLQEHQKIIYDLNRRLGQVCRPCRRIASETRASLPRMLQMEPGKRRLLRLPHAGVRATRFDSSAASRRT